jgi:hypothetical protein
MKKTLLGLLAAAVVAAAPLVHAPDARAAEPKAAGAPKVEGKLDLNSASAEELATLKGIGPARAEAIIKGRPYKGKDELVRREAEVGPGGGSAAGRCRHGRRLGQRGADATTPAARRRQSRHAARPAADAIIRPFPRSAATAAVAHGRRQARVPDAKRRSSNRDPITANEPRANSGVGLRPDGSPTLME